jgi:hypothetical protein
MRPERSGFLKIARNFLRPGFLKGLTGEDKPEKFCSYITSRIPFQVLVAKT